MDNILITESLSAIKMLCTATMTGLYYLVFPSLLSHSAYFGPRTNVDLYLGWRRLSCYMVPKVINNIIFIFQQSFTMEVNSKNDFQLVLRLLSAYVTFEKGLNL